MLQFLLVFLLTVHGLIHLLGFINEWKLSTVQFSEKTLFPLSGRMAKAAGVLWLATTLIFLFTAGLFLFGKANWWMVAAVGVGLSQSLIIAYWPMARYGTLANGLLLLAIVPAFGKRKFDRECAREIPVLLGQAGPAQPVLSAERLTGLPPAVRDWLLRSGAVGRPMPRTVWLRQKGALRTTPTGAWMPVAAEQYYTVHPPAFHWKADIDGGPLMVLNGRDQYLDGRGQMFIQWYSLFRVADASGPETDQGSLLRYLAEIVFFPSAAVQDYIRWDPVDSLHARATMRWGGVTASGIFQFNAAGDAVGFEADRYYVDNKGPANLERWQIRATAFGEFHGIRIPTRGEVTWKLKTGDFTWFQYEITDLEYDPAAGRAAL